MNPNHLIVNVTQGAERRTYRVDLHLLRDALPTDMRDGAKIATNDFRYFPGVDAVNPAPDWLRHVADYNYRGPLRARDERIAELEAALRSLLDRPGPIFHTIASEDEKHWPQIAAARATLEK